MTDRRCCCCCGLIPVHHHRGLGGSGLGAWRPSIVELLWLVKACCVPSRPEWRFTSHRQHFGFTQHAPLPDGIAKTRKTAIAGGFGLILSEPGGGAPFLRNTQKMCDVWHWME